MIFTAGLLVYYYEIIRLQINLSTTVKIRFFHTKILAIQSKSLKTIFFLNNTINKLIFKLFTIRL